MAVRLGDELLTSMRRRQKDRLISTHGRVMRGLSCSPIRRTSRRYVHRAGPGGRPEEHVHQTPETVQIMTHVYRLCRDGTSEALVPAQAKNEDCDLQAHASDSCRVTECG